MDKAPDFGSGDCRFESCQGRTIFIHKETNKKGFFTTQHTFWRTNQLFFGSGQLWFIRSISSCEYIYFRLWWCVHFKNGRLLLCITKCPVAITKGDPDAASLTLLFWRFCLRLLWILYKCHGQTVNRKWNRTLRKNSIALNFFFL